MSRLARATRSTHLYEGTILRPPHGFTPQAPRDPKPTPAGLGLLIVLSVASWTAFACAIMAILVLL